MDLTIDLIDGGYYESADLKRATRFAIVRNIPAGSGHSAHVIACSAPGLPQVGNPHPARPECKLRSIETFSVEADDIVKLRLIYETPRGAGGGGGGGGGPRWVLEDTTGVTNESTNLVPGAAGGDQILVKYQLANEKWMPEDVGTINFLRPVRTITLSGPVAAGADEFYKQAVGDVNDDDWQGKPPGYWLFNGFNSRSVDGGVTKQLTMSFATRNSEDWSTYYCLRDPSTGRPITGDAVNAAAKELRGKPYRYGLTYPAAGNRRGIVKIGPYLPIKFFSLFGI